MISLVDLSHIPLYGGTMEGSYHLSYRFCANLINSTRLLRVLRQAQILQQ